MGEGESTFDPGDMGSNSVEQYEERDRRMRAALARLALDRRARLLQESREPDDASSGPGSGVQDTWASMPHAGKDFQASLAEDEQVTEGVMGGDEDPLDFSDLPVF